MCPSPLLPHKLLPSLPLPPYNGTLSLIHHALEWSAALALHGSLLAVGGRHSFRDSSSAIHLYQPGSRQWVKVGDLPTARDCCSCTLLPSEEILVAGGYNNYKEKISRVDVASLD